MKRIGIVSYNIYANFTNYGSALQSWALNQSISKLGYFPVLIDYCPDILLNINPLDPFNNSWDKDEETKKMIDLSMPSIIENYNKFEAFYSNQFNRSKSYNRINFNDSTNEVDSYVCGSDTIFSPDEFGLDDGYLANYSHMVNNSISYAASFGDPHFSDVQFIELNKKLKNFKALGIRENLMIDYVKSQVNVPVHRVIDPTLLLKPEEYDRITCPNRLIEQEYVLYYSRRYNPIMEKYVEDLAKEKNLKIVEISLRAQNVNKGHIMFYHAGVEEFLSLVKHASFVVTNSFHGMIFSVQFKKEFVVFSRALCDTKIVELLKIFGIEDRLLLNGSESYKPINWERVSSNIEKERQQSIDFLSKSLKLL
ncbi:MAG: polysaccharide pyruvyl transferase family protein [Erysipelotrichaceae bacterium]|nr:polysaccharide pyruvyl transferase family protein [Erysipelotrichaceae bacterium]